MTLGPGDFAAFCSEVHGQRPFPWQSDLVEQVLADDEWPEVIDVPTGLGKTALIDIGVFVAAVTAGQGGADRVGRRRIFFVVDRRIVVDEAHMRARAIAAALESALPGTTTREVTDRLRSLAPTSAQPLTIPPPHQQRGAARPALTMTRMRGGITWEAAWLPRPDLAAVVVGTVDQIGSRLLFRGYGVSDRRKPIDAALVGMDSLVLVDEAHLAAAMTATITAAHRRDRSNLALPRATVVQLTATPAQPPDRRYQLNVDAHRSDEVAWKRLNAAKQLTLKASTPDHIAQDLAAVAVAAVDGGCETILVACNTVDRARQVHGILAAASAKRAPLDADVDLLIGRSRPADREQLVSRLLGRFGLDRPRPSSRAAILVATQTVEVGANLDVDALVTESAPWDSLVQRLGRLNRLGVTPGHGRAVVVHDGVDSAVYGAPRTVAWEKLSALTGPSGIDVSPLACRDLTEEFGGDALCIGRSAPILTAPILDAWTRTAPPPLPDPPLAPYLHGIGSEAVTVGIAWRDGLLVDDPMGDDAERSANEIDAELTMLPISTAESVDVPLYAARRWMTRETPAPVSDLDDDVAEILPSKSSGEPFRALVWRGGHSQPGAPGSVASGAWIWIDAASVRPGDQLVVPVERGGLDVYGWAPTSVDPVTDVAEVVRFAPDGDIGRGKLRIDGLTARRLGLGPDDRDRLNRSRRTLSQATDADTDGDQIDAVLAAAIREQLDRAEPAPADNRRPDTAWTLDALKRLAEWLPGTGLRDVPAGVGLATDRFILTKPRAGAIDRDDEQPECSSLGLSPVRLSAHHRNVGDRARAIAEALMLPTAVCDAVEAAARWHDLGKAEGRFQTMLAGGDEFEALLLDEPLAKSGLDPGDRAAFIRARLRSQLPPGARHEAWSAALVCLHLREAEQLDDFDPDLVVHLVASHHGHARPWLPPVIDEQPTDLTVVIAASPVAGEGKITINTASTVDFDHPARFARLNELYGRWGLALLETIVRCADMTVSEEGS